MPSRLEKAKLPERAGFATGALAREAATSLREMAGVMESSAKLPRLEDLERRLTVLEEKLFAVLMAATPDEDLVNVRAEADRDIAPYRRNMTAAQVEQLAQAVCAQTSAGAVRRAAVEFVLYALAARRGNSLRYHYLLQARW